MLHTVSNDDLQTIKSQLGRTPRGAMEVVVRDAQKIPVVIKVYPVVDGKPFPNLYWLTHKGLGQQIDKLEAMGVIKFLENDLIPKDEDLQTQLKSAHISYAQERMKVLKQTDQWKSLPENYLKALEETGIGGCANFMRVRCLHMHYAHHLVSTNPIGKYLEQNYPELKKSLT